MSDVRQLPMADIIDSDDFVHFIANITMDDSANNLSKNFPELEKAIFEHGRIFAKTFKITDKSCFATRKGPCGNSMFHVTLRPTDVHRVTVQSNFIMSNCPAGTVERLVNEGFKVDELTSIRISDSELSVYDLILLLNDNIKKVYLENCILDEETNIALFWPYIYNATEIVIDVKNITFGELFEFALYDYPRTKPVTVFVLHNLTLEVCTGFMLKYFQDLEKMDNTRLIVLKYTEVFPFFRPNFNKKSILNNKLIDINITTNTITMRVAKTEYASLQYFC